MTDSLVALIVDESKWLAASLLLAALATAMLVHGSRGGIPVRRRIATAMNLFLGVTIGTMAAGHLLAVTVKLAQGTLVGSPVLFYMIGAALAVPSALLVAHARRILAAGRAGPATVLLNCWLAGTLLALGIHNLPLAAPAFLNVGYHLHSRPGLGWTIVGVAVLVNAGLLVGSMVFLASGQSFEQFRGID